ncbi:MAG TPA: hypothetical protein VG819_01990, partial [Rhizomicrobium sp.]|nr:hypothetical protein [Rhizomicrobium sp.]
MAIPDNELCFDYHLEVYQKLGHLTGIAEDDAYWHRNAEYLHALCVVQAALDLQTDACLLFPKLRTKTGVANLRFGIGRRTKQIWLGLRTLLELVHPEHTDPLQHESVEEVSRDLNGIYINIRGVLDNLAWCLAAEFGSGDAEKLAPMSVNLFGRDFLNDNGLTDFADFLGTFADWSRELKKRRDPSAHRIPLSVPPAILDKAAQEEYARLQAEHDEVLKAAYAMHGDQEQRLKLLQKAGEISDAQSRIGTF